MIKIINGWFKCALCPREGDTYYELQHKGKKIKVCRDCLKKIRGKGRGQSKSVRINDRRG